MKFVGGYSLYQKAERGNIMSKKCYVNLILSVLFVGLIGGVFATAALGSGTLNVAIPTDLTNVDLHKTTAQINNWILANTVYEKLFSYDANNLIKPYLCESYTVSDDGKIYTLNLRKGVLFHNGEEMTAEDVKFSIDRARNKDLPSVLAQALQKIVDTKILAPYQVQIVLSEPSNSLLPTLASQVGALIILPKKLLGISKLLFRLKFAYI